MQYTRDFYHDIEPESRASASEMVPRIIELLSPGSVVDVGCGTGVWLAEFEAHGISDIAGIDFGVNPDDLRIPRSNYQAVNLTEPFSLNRTFDIAVSLEVAEHLPEKYAARFVDSLTLLAPVIIFSAAIPYQGGINHVNEQWPDYWARHFQRHDFVPVDCLRNEFWANERVAWWYPQNAILYIKQSSLSRYPELAAMETGTPLPLVHPKNYLAYTCHEPELPGLRQLLNALPAAFSRSVKRRLKHIFMK